ncbi:uncharacterized protein KY384_003698 [Bacidia gigantensis]|uniref:uncharacterized protein n=1 Tax=Bacidia gigantensis TaxID=2732470 RepID=UPI001D036BA6|nr:uncharacterized protein KY384_003698 [Bacidia gigantensis]KAG8532061.1 hypothetical protein KY384_003698 [Bacidia gigantensis]
MAPDDARANAAAALSGSHHHEGNIDATAELSQLNMNVAGPQSDRYTAAKWKVRCETELSMSVPWLERIKAVRVIADEVRPYSEVESLALLENVRDMAASSADLEARRVVFWLFQALASIPISQQLQIQLFDLITIPVDDTLAYAQISALGRLAEQESLAEDLQANMATHIVDRFNSLFTQGEKARHIQHVNPNAMSESADGATRKRPEEEKALLKALTILSGMIKIGGQVLDFRRATSLTAMISDFLGKTTGNAIMIGLLQLSSDCVVHVQMPANSLQQCLHILCGVAREERYKFRAEADKTLAVLLRFRRQEVILAANDTIFQRLLHSFLDVIKSDPPRSGEETDLCLSFAEGVVDIFLEIFQVSARRAVAVYNICVQIAAVARLPNVKLAVMKLLVRVRCDLDYGVRVTRDTESEDNAAILHRIKIANVPIHMPSLSSDQKVASDSTSTSSTGSRSRKSNTYGQSSSRSAARPPGNQTGFLRAEEKLWVYEDEFACPTEIPSPVLLLQSNASNEDDTSYINIGRWLKIVIDEIKTSRDWEIYSYILVHLPSQLRNCSLFQGQAKQISELHDLLNEILSDNTFLEPPERTGVRRGDVALCLYDALITLLGYRDFIGLRQWNRAVSTIRIGIEKWDRVGKFAMQALTICCYEIPNIIENHLTMIVEMMQKRITQSEFATDILEFLAALARLPDAYDRSNFSLHQKIFGICIRYLQYSREHRKGGSANNTVNKTLGSRTSGSSGEGFKYHKQPLVPFVERRVYEYVFTIAYQTMIFWFLALDVHERARHVAWIAQELALKVAGGKEEMEQQSLVFLDMMHRTTYSDLGETYSALQTADPNRNIIRGMWLLGLSVVAIEVVCDEDTGKPKISQFTKRQASGTTYAVYYHNTEERPAHQVVETSGALFDQYPNHLMLQMFSTVSPIPTPMQPIPLPSDDDMTNRVIRLFDATETVDGHKAAVIYVDIGQTQEGEILGNRQGSESFDAFLSKLGFRVSLKNAKFNTQGLDRQYGSDGTHTYAWRDRVSEIVFHVPTIMPDDPDDEGYARKKSHVGNDHVKIIFNDSGVSYRPGIFPSDFNSVSIVITPEAPSKKRGVSRIKKPSILDKSNDRECSDTEEYGYFHVQTLTSESYPPFSPATNTKVVSAGALPSLVRQLAITASVFCQVWHRNLGEYTSCWRFRLQQILKLRDRYANANASANVDYPQVAEAEPATYTEGGTWSGNVAFGGIAEANKLASSLDFTRWTK